MCGPTYGLTRAWAKKLGSKPVFRGILKSFFLELNNNEVKKLEKGSLLTVKNDKHNMHARLC